MNRLLMSYDCNIIQTITDYILPLYRYYEKDDDGGDDDDDDDDEEEEEKEVKKGRKQK